MWAEPLGIWNYWGPEHAWFFNYGSKRVGVAAGPLGALSGLWVHGPFSLALSAFPACPMEPPGLLLLPACCLLPGALDPALVLASCSLGDLWFFSSCFRHEP